MIPMIAAIAIAAVILTSLALLSENDILPFQPPPKAFDWECSGPICIRPAEVKLGENIFIIADGIEEDEVIRLSLQMQMENIGVTFTLMVQINLSGTNT